MAVRPSGCPSLDHPSQCALPNLKPGAVPEAGKLWEVRKAQVMGLVGLSAEPNAQQLQPGEEEDGYSC